MFNIRGLRRPQKNGLSRNLTKLDAHGGASRHNVSTGAHASCNTPTSARHQQKGAFFVSHLMRLRDLNTIVIVCTDSTP